MKLTYEELRAKLEQSEADLETAGAVIKDLENARTNCLGAYGFLEKDLKVAVKALQWAFTDVHNAAMKAIEEGAPESDTRRISLKIVSEALSKLTKK